MTAGGQKVRLRLSIDENGDVETETIIKLFLARTDTGYNCLTGPIARVFVVTTLHILPDFTQTRSQNNMDSKCQEDVISFVRKTIIFCKVSLSSLH